ncbi:MAG: sulfotransferase family 2 domain-containing protein [Ramlibacter sp.]
MNFRHAIWIRTPKIGGTSVDASLRDHLMLNSDGGEFHFETCPPEGFYFADEKIFCLGANTAHELGTLSRTHPRVWDEAFKFAVVRNPYDRFVSGWKYLHSTREMSLDHLLSNLPAQGPDHVHLTMRQWDFLNIDGQFPDIHLLRFEELQNGLDELCDLLGIEKRKLEVLNKTPGERLHYMDYFSQQHRATVADRYRLDFETFGYEA